MLTFSAEKFRVLYCRSRARITRRYELPPVFIHIPKTGGRSVVAACGTGILNLSHRPLSYYQSIFGRDLAFFCFTRNPFDRLTSAYFYLSRGGCTRTDRQDRDRYVRGKTFEQFVLSLPDCYLEQQHLRPQVRYVQGCADVTCVGRFETLENDFAQFCGRYHIHQRPLVKTNATAHPHFRELYTKKMIDVVTELYAEDFACFGYSRTLG